MRRSGFTLLEVMLASSIASVIGVTAITLTQYITRQDRRLSRRFEDLSQLGRARQAIQLAMLSLVGEPDPPENASTAGRSDLARERFGDEPLRDQLFPDDGPLPLFILGDTIPTQHGEWAPRKIEMRLKRPPVRAVRPERSDRATPPSESTEEPPELPTSLIHGAFELVTYPLEPYFTEQGRESWALLWTPVNPPGEPVVLVDAIEFAAWEALDHDMQWNDELRARVRGDFPMSIHVELRTWAGARADWLFEPIVEGREGL